jgi:hypothetical protein
MLGGAGSKSLLLNGRPRAGLLTEAFRGPRTSRIVQGGGDVAATVGVTMTGVGSANTKGDWFEVEDSLSFDADGFYFIPIQATARSRHFTDVGIGADGAEVVLVPDIPYVSGAVGLVGGSFYIPIRISAGTRVAVRHQSNSTTATSEIHLIFVASEQARLMSCVRATAYGHVHASTISACLPDPNNTANTKGIYDEMVASTTNPMKAWTFFITTQSQDFTIGRLLMTDLAVGAGGSESVILGDQLTVVGASGDHLQPPDSGPYWYPVPAGVRLSARQQSTDASEVALSYCYVLGFD